MKSKLTLLLTGLCLLLGSCQKGLETSDYDETGSCTVLVYMVAENSLYSNIYGNINDMLRAAPKLRKGERVVLYVDDREFPRMYIIDKDSKTRFFDPVFEFNEDFNSASAGTLEKVIEYTRSLCPAREYGYVFWSHGSGWIPDSDAAKAQTRAFGADNQKNSTSNMPAFHMNVTDLADVLHKFGKARFVMFDACFMQTIEVAYELRDVTDYIIGSPAEIPAYGAPYDLQLSHYFADPFCADSLAYDYWDLYANDDEHNDMGIAASVIKTSELEQLAAATRRYIRIDNLSELDVRLLRNNYFRWDEWRYGAHYPDACDMRSIMKYELSASDYEEWMKSLRRAVPAWYCTKSWYSAYCERNLPIDSTQFCGVSMYIPRSEYRKKGESFYNDYYETSWYKAISGE